MILLSMLFFIGFALSAYAYNVETRFEEAQRLGIYYRAYCDVGMFSCTSVFSSRYASLTTFVGLPKFSNAAVGMVFYFFEFIMQRVTSVVLLTTFASCLASVGLFVLLTFVMHDFCIVCFTVYVVNFLSAFLVYRDWKRKSIVGGGSRSRKAGASPRPIRQVTTRRKEI